MVRNNVQRLGSLKKMTARLKIAVCVAIIGIGIAASGSLFVSDASAAPANFVYRNGNKMMLNGGEYKFVGFNAYGMTGCETGTPWNQAQIDAYFQSLPPGSMTRLWAFKDWNSNLDLIISRAAAYNQKLVLTLGNGLKNCERINFDNNVDNGSSKGAAWFQTNYKGAWMNWVKSTVTKHKDSAAVGMWEISNEAGHPDKISATIMKPFFEDVASAIKAIDSQHLVSTGALADYTYGGEANYQSIHSSNNIDVVSFHEYDGGTISNNFPAALRVAKALNKPLMVGETGSPDSNLCGQARSDYLKARFDAYLGQGASGVLIWNRSLQNCGGWAVGPGDATANMVSNYKIAGVVTTPPTTPPPTTPPTTPPATGTGCTTQATYGSASSTINVPTTGTYRIWSRISAPDTTNNSYLLEIDGKSCHVVGDANLTANTWTWVDYQNGSDTANNKITASLSAGNHTVKLIGREANVKVDKIMAIADQNCKPKDLGDISQCAAAGDTTIPTVSITAPADGSTVNGKLNVTANATDDKAVSKVEFLVQNVVKATDTTAPYSFEWDTTAQANGSYAVTARAYDSSGNTASDTNTAIVKNGDTTPPSTPGNVKATANAYNRVTVTWSASTDNVAVTGYWVLRGGVTVATLGAGTTSYTDTSVSGGTQYTYQVMAFDAANNKSPASAAAGVTTPPVQTADTTPPSKPTQLTASVISKSQINIGWMGSTDNVGVKQYDIFRGIGQGTPSQIATTTQTSYGDTGLAANTAYTYYVVARDTAGNTAKSDNASATTKANEPQQQAKSTLRGSVQSRSGRPIPGARVTLWVNDRRYTATTNWRGQYIITNIPSGRYDIYFRAYGYDRYWDRIRMNPGKTKWYDVQLRR